MPDDHPWAHLVDDDYPVEVHGGLTYGPNPRIYPEGTGGWIGFDCQHAFDYWGEAEEAWYAEMGLTSMNRPRPGDYFPTITWTKEMVIEEAKRLAMQVASAYEIKVVKGEVIA